MYEIDMLFKGFDTLAHDPVVLLLALLGVALGIIIGVLPGLTATMGVAILLPFTFGMDPLSGILMISGVFFGGIYGGSITAILLKIPGTPAAAATAMDGYALTQKGQAGIALGTATISSCIGGTLSVFMLIFLAPLLAGLALEFSAAETFALAIFGLSIITSVSGDSLIKGLIAGFAGLLLSTVGLDPMEAFPRFTGGFTELFNVPFVPVMIGLFAASEGFKSLGQEQTRHELKVVIGRIIPPWVEFRGMITTILRSSGLGVIVGIIPGAGADIASFVAYNEAKRFSKNPENFGKGELKAVAACESGANSCTGGDILPMMTLGIPGDAVTAIMLGALTMQGLQPGPLLFKEHAPLVFTLFAGMLFCYVSLLVVGLSSLRLMGKVLEMPRSVLSPLILALSVVGAYAINNSMFDVGIMFLVGVVGFFMQRWDFPPSPVVLALIMGPMAESNFRRALSLSGGSFDFLYTRPITAGLLLVAIITLAAPVLRRSWRGGKS
jgi:putative tricarboxylic transport membrane protein